MRRHGWFNSALALMVLFIASPGLAAIEDLIDAVPADASFVLHVGDVQRTLEQWQVSSLDDLWRDPRVSAFFAPLRRDLEIDRWDAVLREETGAGLDEIRATLTGGLVVYIEQIGVSIADGEEDLDLSMAVLAEVGSGAAKLNEAMVQRQAGTAGGGVDGDDAETVAASRIETREFRGLTVAEGARTDGDSDEPRLCDPAAIPAPGTFGRYLSTAVNGIWKDDRVLRTRTIILSADAK